MSNPFPSLTEKWHSEPYPAIDPTRPELSCKGKVVAITGGGGAIGNALARAFAKAGAAKIAILGRSESSLDKSKQAVESQVKGAQITPVKGDITDEASIRNAFSKIAKELGKIDILVANAGYLPHFESVMEADFNEWWTGFEINAKGAFNTCRAFLPNASDKPTLVEITTCPIAMPAMASASGYIASKLAANKVYETFKNENSSVSVFHVHPGIVYSDINVKSGIKAVDSADLPAQFVVWAVSDEAKFLKGKNVLYCNWDVEELKRREEELSNPYNLILTLQGWPWGQSPDGGTLAH